MEFLYPRSRQFPFDEVSELIVRAMEDRNWNVPGLKVTFDEYGSGDSKFRMVRYIRGEDFKLYFGRAQGQAGNDRRHTWNDTAAITEMVIPGKEIHVYEDESGPTFYLYVGSNWAEDREQFMNDLKVNSKLNGKPKTYLEYKGGCNCRQTQGASFPAVGFITALLSGNEKALMEMHHTHSNRRPPVLVHTNDLQREYNPTNYEPTVFLTDGIMEEFRLYLEYILQIILSEPLPPTKVDIFAKTEIIPFPDSIGPLFTFGEGQDAERIKLGKKDPGQLEPSSRYGLFGSGYRLVPWSAKNTDSVPKIAFEGFCWCGIGEVDKKTPIGSLVVYGHYRWSDREQYVIRVRPNRANDIYIADHSAYEKRRYEISETLGGRDRFTNAEVDDFTCARGRTIVPITEYTGGFEKPIVLICRELSLDEVEIVSGPTRSG